MADKKISQLPNGGAVQNGDLIPIARGSANYALSGSVITAKQDVLTAANFGSFSTGLTAKTTPIDADTFNIVDSAAANVEKKLSWANIKATLKTYFDTLYLSLTGGTMTGNLIVNAKETVGSTANLVDFPNAQFFASQANSGDTHTYNMGVVGEAVASNSDTNIWGVGIYGKGSTNGATRSAGILGDGGVSATGDTGSAIGVRGYSTDTHAGGANIGLYGDAAAGATNYALYMNRGDIFANAAQVWNLLDNNAASLSFDAAGKTGLLKLDTTDGVESVSSSANIYAVNVGTGLTKTTASGGTLTLDVNSNYQQTISGSSAHTVVLPVVSTLRVGQGYLIRYIGTGTTNSITINSSGGNLVASISKSGYAIVVFNGTAGTGSSSWDVLLGTSGSANGGSVVVRDISGDTTLRILTVTSGIKTGSNAESLSGNKTLSESSPQYQFLNPNGSNRDVTLPAAVTNLLFIIKNTGSAGNTLTVKDSGGTAITGGTIANTVVMGFFYDGSAWQLV